MKIFKVFTVFFIFSLFCLIPNLVQADVTITNPITATSVEALVEGVTNFIFWVATALVPLMIVIGAFYFVTSAGNPRQIDTAKKIILYTLIGYAIILISKGLIIIVRDILGVSS